MSEFLRSNLCLFAVHEARLNLVWLPNSETTKYTKAFEPIFGKQRFSWCAAFVHFNVNMAGGKFPIHAPHTNVTFALCEGWQKWAQAEDLWHQGTEGIEAGDIIIFDWDHDDNDDHMGIYIGMTEDGKRLVCAEGNCHNKTALKERNKSVVVGYIRLPDGFEFPKQELVLG